MEAIRKGTKCHFCKAYYQWREIDISQSYGAYVTKKEYRVALRHLETRPCEKEPYLNLGHGKMFKANFCPECGTALIQPRNDRFYKQSAMLGRTYQTEQLEKVKRHYNRKEQPQKEENTIV